MPRTVKQDWSLICSRGRRLFRWEINANILIVQQFGPSCWVWLAAPKGQDYLFAASGVTTTKIEAQLAAESAGGIHRGGTFSMPKSPMDHPYGTKPPVFAGDV